MKAPAYNPFPLLPFLLMLLCFICGCGKPSSEPKPAPITQHGTGIFEGQWLSKTNVRFMVHHPFDQTPTLHAPTPGEFRAVQVHGRTLSFDQHVGNRRQFHAVLQISINDVNYAMLTLEPEDGGEPLTEMLSRREP